MGTPHGQPHERRERERSREPPPSGARPPRNKAKYSKAGRDAAKAARRARSFDADGAAAALDSVRSHADAIRPRSDADAFNGPRGDAFKPRAEAFKPRGDGEREFKPRGDGYNGYKQHGDGKREFKPRGDGYNGYKQHGDGKREFKPRGDGFKPRGDGERSFKPRGDGFKARGGDGKREFKPRGDGEQHAGAKRTTSQRSDEAASGSRKEQARERLARHTKSDSKVAMIDQLKSFWEELRVKKIKPRRRAAIISAMREISKDRLYEVVSKHDASRIVQTMIKFCSPETRVELYAELRPHLFELSERHYSAHLLLKILKYGSTQIRDEVFTDLLPHCRRLLMHKEGAFVLDAVYRFSKPQSADRMVAEALGGLFRLHAAPGDCKVGPVIAAHPQIADQLRSDLRTVVESLASKGMLQYPLAQRVALQYLEIATLSDRCSFAELVRENFIYFVHTKEGATLSMMAISYGTAKDRKAMIKATKTFVFQLATDEFGSLVLIKLLRTVDDTKLMRQILLSELIPRLDELLANAHSARVLGALYNESLAQILAPPRAALFDASEPIVPDGTDQSTLKFLSKKDMSSRLAELRAGVHDALAAPIAAALSALLCLPAARTVIDWARHASAEQVPSAQLTAIAANLGEGSPMRHNGGHRALKSLIRTGAAFANAIAAGVQVREALAYRESTFVLVALVEEPTTRDAISAALAPLRPLAQVEANDGSVAHRLLLDALDGRSQRPTEGAAKAKASKAEVKASKAAVKASKAEAKVESSAPKTPKAAAKVESSAPKTPKAEAKTEAKAESNAPKTPRAEAKTPKADAKAEAKTPRAEAKTPRAEAKTPKADAKAEAKTPKTGKRSTDDARSAKRHAS